MSKKKHTAGSRSRMSVGLASSHGRHLIGDFPEVMSMGGEVGDGRPEAVKSGKGAYTGYSSIHQVT